MLGVAYGDIPLLASFTALTADLITCVSLPRMRVHSCFVYLANLTAVDNTPVDCVHFSHDIARGQTFRPHAAFDSRPTASSKTARISSTGGSRTLQEGWLLYDDEAE